jgi:hypothetical protein
MMLCLDEFGVEHELETDLDRYERDFLSYSWEELVDLYDLKDQDKVVFEYKGKNEFENIFVIHAEKLPELGSFTTIHKPETVKKFIIDTNKHTHTHARECLVNFLSDILTFY